LVPRRSQRRVPRLGGDIDYGFAIADDETVLFTGDHEGGMPGVLFETTEPAVLAWARDTFEDLYERSVLASDARE
jgi:hypothetical protein